MARSLADETAATGAGTDKLDAATAEGLEVIATSQAYATLMANARMAGLAISVTDGYIAAIAVANGMKMATRDTAPFEASGLEVVDPWAA